jgi:integrase-like protein
MKTELVHQVRYPTRDAAQRDLFAYIEGYYNRQWLHFALGYITPEQVERQAASVCSAQADGFFSSPGPTTSSSSTDRQYRRKPLGL